jgi:hypothetical protein
MSCALVTNQEGVETLFKTEKEKHQPSFIHHTSQIYIYVYICTIYIHIHIHIYIYMFVFSLMGQLVPYSAQPRTLTPSMDSTSSESTRKAQAKRRSTLL